MKKNIKFQSYIHFSVMVLGGWPIWTGVCHVEDDEFQKESQAAIHHLEEEEGNCASPQ